MEEGDKTKEGGEGGEEGRGIRRKGEIRRRVKII